MALDPRQGPDKEAIVVALRATVQQDLDAMAALTQHTREEATGAESRAEGKYDTRATEASYLASGQGRRLAALKHLAAWLVALDPSVSSVAVGLGALVGLERDGQRSWVLIAPEGGHRVTVGAIEVRTISGRSPLGQALAGLQEGDGAEVETPRGPQELEIVWVS